MSNTLNVNQSILETQDRATTQPLEADLFRFYAKQAPSIIFCIGGVWLPFAMMAAHHLPKHETGIYSLYVFAVACIVLLTTGSGYMGAKIDSYRS